MKFIINILSDQYLDHANLASFIDNLKLQDNVDYQLVLKQTNLRGDQIDQIHTDFPMVQLYHQYQEIKLSSKVSYYWLNLSVADGLLPSAMIQWTTILNRHKTELLLLTTLNNHQNLQKQLTESLESIGEVKINTVKSVLDLPAHLELDQIDLRDQLQMILGLQTYRLMDKPSRYNNTFDNMDLLGKNVLYHVHHHELEEWDANFAKRIIERLINTTALIKVELPTLILNENDWQIFAKEVIGLFKNPPTILDEKLLNTYHDFSIRKLSLAIQKTRHLKNNDDLTVKDELKDVVKHLSSAEKRQLTLTGPVTFIENFIERG